MGLDPYLKRQQARQLRFPPSSISLLKPSPPLPHSFGKSCLLVSLQLLSWLCLSPCPSRLVAMKSIVVTMLSWQDVAMPLRNGPSTLSLARSLGTTSKLATSASKLSFFQRRIYVLIFPTQSCMWWLWKKHRFHFRKISCYVQPS